MEHKKMVIDLFALASPRKLSVKQSTDILIADGKLQVDKKISDKDAISIYNGILLLSGTQLDIYLSRFEERKVINVKNKIKEDPLWSPLC